MNEKRIDVAKAHRLDSAERLLWLPPAEVIDTLALGAGEVVADVGAGTGYFSLPLADAVRPGGRVYAIDAQPEMLSLLRNKLSQQSASVELVCAEGSDTRLPDGICNLVFMANVWHEFDDRGAVLREARRILRADGRLAILDWRTDVDAEHGPSLEHRLSASEAEAELAAAGFHSVQHRNIGSYSWLVQARPSLL